jgi:hypothetical protein
MQLKPKRRNVMKLNMAGLAVIAVLTSLGTSQAINADRKDSLTPGPTHVVTIEPGVVPAGSPLIVRMDDTINTDRGYRNTIYGATLAYDVVDQNGEILMPKGSSVDLAVYSFGFLGPGGGGMTKLVLGVRALTVKGVSYPVETAAPPRDGGLSSGYTPKWIGGAGEARQVLTEGNSIHVSEGALLLFQTLDPIRLKGYRR